MPELPDVEGFRRLMAAKAAGRRVVEVHAPGPGVLRNTTPQRLGRVVADGRLGAPWRHGKWLFAPVTRPAGGRALVLMHFGMDGALIWEAGDRAGRPAAARGRRGGAYDRLILCCEGGELRYHSIRKLGGVWLTRGEAEAGAVTGPLGPDALGLGRAELERLLARRRGGLKAALMDQALVAGLGNLTVDEILWRARLHPRARASGLGPGEARRLHDGLRTVLAESVTAGRVPAWEGWLTAARARRAPACPRCAGALERARIAGRGTLWCPRCQPDRR